MNILTYKLKYVSKLLLIPISFSIFLIIWFYSTEFLGYNFIINNTGLFQPGSTIGNIENSFYRTFSHNSEMHLRNNIMSFIILSTIILFVQKTKYYILQLSSYIIISAIVLSNYPNGVGFSLVTSALHSTAFLLCLFSLRYNNHNHKSFYYGTIFYLLILIYMTRQIILDMSMVLGFSDIYGFDLINLIWTDLGPNYTVVSAEVHLIGSIIGIFIFFIMIIYTKIFGRSMFKDYTI